MGKWPKASGAALGPPLPNSQFSCSTPQHRDGPQTSYWGSLVLTLKPPLWSGAALDKSLNPPLSLSFLICEMRTGTWDTHLTGQR